MQKSLVEKRPDCYVGSSVGRIVSSDIAFVVAAASNAAKMACSNYFVGLTMAIVPMEKMKLPDKANK